MKGINNFTLRLAERQNGLQCSVLIDNSIPGNMVGVEKDGKEIGIVIDRDVSQEQAMWEVYKKGLKQRERGNLTAKRARLAMAFDDLFHAGGNGESVIQALDEYFDAKGK